MKRFFYRALKTALILGAILAIYDELGPVIAGDYFWQIWWGIVTVSILILSMIIWRLIAGVRSGDLLFDDLDD